MRLDLAKLLGLRIQSPRHSSLLTPTVDLRDSPNHPWAQVLVRKTHRTWLKVILLMVMSIIGKGYRLKSDKKEMHRAESGRVPNASLLLSSPHGVRMCFSPGIIMWQYAWNIANQENSLELWSFCGDFITQAWLLDSLIIHMVDYSPDQGIPCKPNSLPWIRWLVFLPRPALILKLSDMDSFFPN